MLLPDLAVSDLSNSIALTFDDGPEQPWTGHVLEILRRRGVPATFFVLGTKVEAETGLLERIVSAGCEVGIHGWDHRRWPELTSEELRENLRRTTGLIYDLTGRWPRFARPPHGDIDRRTQSEMEQASLRAVFWSVVAWDWTRPGTAAIVEHVEYQLQPGSIILLHDGGGDRSQTVAAIEPILDLVEERGLVPVSLAPPLT